MPKAGQHALVPIWDIELDYQNPRINRFLANYSRVSQESLLLALGAGEEGTPGTGTTFASLKESIRTNGGIIHPIIVDRKADDRMVAVEGNTRLAIYQGFHEEGVPGDWSKIPCIIYDQLSQEDIDAIRLQAHLVGPRPWDPYSKAKYLHHLRTFEHMDFGRLSDLCGGRKREVERYINAYIDMEKYYRPLVNESEFDTKKFSSFVEMQAPPDRKQALVNAGFTMGDFSQWVIDGLFERQEDVRALPRILANPKAREVFLKEGAQAAKRLIDLSTVGTDLSTASIDDLCAELIQKLGQVPRSELTRMKKDPNGDSVRLLQDCIVEIQATLDFVLDEEE